LVQVEESGEVSRFHADPVQLDPADLRPRPAQLLGRLVPGEPSLLPQPAQLGGEPALPDGLTALIRHPSASSSRGAIPATVTVLTHSVVPGWALDEASWQLVVQYALHLARPGMVPFKETERPFPYHLRAYPAWSSAVHRGQQRSVGPDQGRVLQWEQRAVRMAAFGHPLIGQVHGRGAVRRRRAHLARWYPVEERIQPGHRVDQRLRGIRRLLVLPVHPPPLDLQPGRLGDVPRLAVSGVDQAVEP